MRNVKIFFFCLAVLSAALVLIVNYINPSPSAKEIAATITKNVQTELLEIDQEGASILSEHNDASWDRATHSFYLINDNVVSRWNQNEFLPDIQWAKDGFTTKLLRLPMGDFLIRKWTISELEFLMAVVPLHVDYKISNRYLAPNWNQRIFNTSDIVIADSNVDGGEAVLSSTGDVLFHIELTSQKPEIYSRTNVLLLAFTSTSVVCGLIFLCCFVLELHCSRKYEKALFVLMLGLASIRAGMLLLGLPQAFTNSPIFDPKSFASSLYNPSLGDLLLNAMAVLLVISYFFLTYSRFKMVRSIRQGSGRVKLVLSIVFLLAAIFSFLFPFLFIETISNNSAIALDITQSLSFTELRSLAYFALLIGSISGFLGAHVFFRISISLVDSKTQFFAAYGAAMIIFCIYFLTAGRDYWITVVVATSYFVILLFTKLYKHASRISFRSSFYFFLIALAFGVQASFSLKRFVEENQKKSQLRFGNNFLVDRDILGEYLLHESSMKIASDPLVQSRIANPFLGRSIIREKIRQVYLSSYFDRYDVQIYLYDSRGEPLDNVSVANFASYINALQTTASKTEYDGLYFVKNTDLQSTKRYAAVVPINYHNISGGFVVLDLSLKRIIPQNVYPELLLDNRFSQYAQSKDFSYAFLTSQGILSSFGDFNYEKDFRISLLDDPVLYSSGVSENGFNHIAIADESGRTAIISAPAYSWFFMLTNVAFFFIFALLLLFFLLLCYGVMAWLKSEQLNYSARIQLYIHMAFLIPLLAVSLTTLSLTARSAQDQLNNEFSEKSKLLSERIIASLDNLQRDSVVQDREVENQLTDLARLINVDVSLYDTLGYLIASTQPLIFENQLVTPLINRDAWEKIVRDKERDYINTEGIGLLKYNTSYVAIKSPQSRALMGIICLPFFDSASSLERNQTIVFANIIDIFFIVFILFSILSFFAADELTFPLRFITKTLRRTTLGDNKPLSWNANDEIGLMVNEYNRMVENLDASKIELARNQKESAWREIAKQVAHEINNPLTPMKLTLQQMDKNLASGNLTPEKTSQSIRTLLEQVDILNEIAASFSAFARMPAPLLIRVDVVTLLEKVVELHKNERSGVINLVVENGPLHVLGDTQLLNRIFSNLILNALQSGKENVLVNVKVTARREETSCLIIFKDDGIGISERLKEKIFLPHFTTKKTGSGIGLAIARQGIEQSGGEIWFESTEGVGTTFYIKLPCVV